MRRTLPVGEDQYRCYPLDLGLSQRRFITGIEFVVVNDNAKQMDQRRDVRRGHGRHLRRLSALGNALVCDGSRGQRGCGGRVSKRRSRVWLSDLHFLSFLEAGYFR